VYASVQSFGWDAFQWSGVLGIVSTFGSPTFLGSYLVVVLPFALYRLTATGRDILAGDGRAAQVRYVAYLTLSLLMVGVLLRIAIVDR